MEAEVHAIFSIKMNPFYGKVNVAKWCLCECHLQARYISGTLWLMLYCEAGAGIVFLCMYGYCAYFGVLGKDVA